MTPEERLNKIETQLELVATQLTHTGEMIDELRATQAHTEDVLAQFIVKTTDAILSLTKVVERHIKDDRRHT